MATPLERRLVAVKLVVDDRLLKTAEALAGVEDGRHWELAAEPSADGY